MICVCCFLGVSWRKKQEYTGRAENREAARHQGAVENDGTQLGELQGGVKGFLQWK